jgi:hypothetical protein
MTITLSLSPEEEKRLAERAAQSGQEVAEYVHRLIERDIQDLTGLDRVLAPVRQQFDESGMTDEELDALVEEAREEVWQEKHGRPSKAS